MVLSLPFPILPVRVTIRNAQGSGDRLRTAESKSRLPENDVLLAVEKILDQTFSIRRLTMVYEATIITAAEICKREVRTVSDWLLNLSVVWMAIVILGTTYVFAAGVYALVTALAKGDRGRAFKAISPGMLAPLAAVFALLVAFLAAQVWSDADRANT